MAKAKIIGTEWGFATLWGQALDAMPERPLQKREHVWASELGGAFIDRYLKMHAVPYTNPPNNRSRRKFVSGHIWEWIVSIILTMAGILKAKQLRGEVELPGLLRVSGKLDFIAGGTIDWEKSRFEIKRIQELFALTVDELPPFIFHAINHIVEKMEKMYGNNPLKEVVFECKSVSSFMSEKLEKTKKAMPHNVLQNYHYILANKEIDEGKLVYVCKDDAICHEFQILNSREIMKHYKEDVRQMTEFLTASNKRNPLKSMPPKEYEVLFDEVLYRFHTNFRVEYSNYLEMLYGLATPDDYRRKWSKPVASWNRVFKRCVRGEKMTDKNKIAIRDVVRIFPMWDKYVQQARIEGMFLKPDDMEDEV